MNSFTDKEGKELRVGDILHRDLDDRIRIQVYSIDGDAAHFVFCNALGHKPFKILHRCMSNTFWVKA